MKSSKGVHKTTMVSRSIEADRMLYGKQFGKPYARIHASRNDGGEAHTSLATAKRSEDGYLIRINYLIWGTERFFTGKKSVEFERTLNFVTIENSDGRGFDETVC